MLKSVGMIVLLVGAVVGDRGHWRVRRSVPDGALVSLTKLISSGNIAQAQQAAYVYPPLFGVKSYAHFFTVNEEYNSNIFFWYVPVTTGDPNAPLVLWMQGGPGTSSLLGFFAEHGPVSIDSKLNPVPRDFAWNKKYNMLYFDNPVGAGFSYTENDKGYAKNMDDVGTNLYSALIQFLQLFPDLQKNAFFITGESYAGKYIPALAHYIHKNNPTAPLKVNLNGFSIGNGLSDPPNMLDYSNHLYQIGLIDDAGKAEVELYEAKIKALIAIGDWEAASATLGMMGVQIPNLQPYPSLFKNLTGLTNVYNYLNQNEPVRYWIQYINQPDIKNIIHVYDRSFADGNEVKIHFANDLLKSVKPWIEELLGFYRVLIYTGQLDIAVPSKQVHDYTKKLVFPGTVQYHLAQRSKWMVGNMIGGFVKTGGLLTDLVVRNSGHMMPMDQPALAWDLIDRFVNNKSFSNAP